jgi:outer membrane protein TolC
MKRLAILLIGLIATAGRVRAEGPGNQALTIDEALRLARANHPQLHVSHAQTEASSARVAEAKAPLLPQVNGNASYARSTANYVPQPGALPKNISTSTQTSTSTSTSTSASSPSSSSWNTVPSYNAKITASELIYDFGQTKRTNGILVCK